MAFKVPVGLDLDVGGRVVALFVHSVCPITCDVLDIVSRGHGTQAAGTKLTVGKRMSGKNQLELEAGEEGGLTVDGEAGDFKTRHDEY